MARSSVKGIGSSIPARAILTSTSVPGRPRSDMTARSGFQPRADSPSTSTIRSPARMPARSPGVPGRALITVIHSPWRTISSPTPAYSPSVLMRRLDHS